MNENNVVATGKTVEEAYENLKRKLGVDSLDGYECKILELGKKGLFGIGNVPAKVAAILPDSEEAPAEKAETVKAETPAAPAKAAPVKPAPAKAAAKAEEKPAKAAPAKGENDRAASAKKSAAPALVIEPETDEDKAAMAFVNTLLKNLSLDAKAEMTEGDEGVRRISILGADAGALIGHHGETLDAFQYLTNLAANRASKHNGERCRVTVDAENYRAKREETLRALARRMAAKAKKYNRNVVLEPMNPYERRIIHSEIQGIPGVSTNSVGADNNRKVVIYLTDKTAGKNEARTAPADGAQD